MLAKVRSAAVFGIEAYLLDIEVYIAKGDMPYIAILGYRTRRLRRAVIG